MKLTGFFKLNQNKRFNYTPIYHNPEKEEREARVRKIKQELGIKEDEKAYVPDIKGKFHGNYSRRGQTSKKTPFYRLVIMLITIGLVALVFYLIFHYTSLMLYNV